jgi:hypothetical protein
VKYYLLSRNTAPSASDPLIRQAVFEAGGQTYDLYQNPSTLPRAYLVHDVVLTNTLEQTLSLLDSDFLDRFRSRAYVEGRLPALPDPLPTPPLESESVRVTHQAPGRLELDVSCPKSAFLVCIENYDPGWQAELDGRPVPVYPTNLFMTGVAFPAGEHRVTLVYRSAAFRKGRLAAGCSAVLLSAVCVWLKRRRRTAVAG